MREYVKYLFFKYHPHKWKPTHYNRWFLPTAYICNLCGKTAHLERFEVNNGLGFGDFYWIYSDGTKTVHYPLDFSDNCKPKKRG